MENDGLVKTLFALTESHGPAWQPGAPLTAQEDWEGHRIFMDDLAKRGFVVLGGPLDGTDDILLIIKAADETEVNNTLAADPWRANGVLERKDLRKWTILLEAGE